MKKPIVRKVDQISVSHFYERYKNALELELLNSPRGMSRTILQPTLNRPGLALAGFFSYFAHERIQIFGAAEMSYLSTTLKGDLRAERLRWLMNANVSSSHVGRRYRRICCGMRMISRYACSAPPCRR